MKFTVPDGISKILNRFLNWILIILYLVIVLGFVSIKRNKIRCNSIDIIINDTTNNVFIERDDIMPLIYGRKEMVLGSMMDSLNIAQLEKKIIEHPLIKDAEVYKTIDGRLIIEITQRNPIIRILNKRGQSYYIDSEGAIMPLSDRYTARILIANGEIAGNFKPENNINVIEMYNNSEQRKAKILYDLYSLAQYIDNHKFFKAQIEQIFVNHKQEFELYPKVGRHVILFGSIENYKEKFRNLEALYKLEFTKSGWNKYKYVNLKYKNQVVCVKD
jgi:cell division protein FtsQ